MGRYCWLFLIVPCLYACPDVDKYARSQDLDAQVGDAAAPIPDTTPDMVPADSAIDQDMGVDGADTSVMADMGDPISDGAPPRDVSLRDGPSDSRPMPRSDQGSGVPDRCLVSFTVTLPEDTPAEAIFIAGTGFGTQEWVPNEASLTLTVVDGVTRLEHQTGHLNRLTYKYTRGSWDTVESTPDCGEITNRSVVVDCARGGSYDVNDVVSNWADLCR